MDIARVLLKIRPGASWSINNNDYKTLEWLDESKRPSLKEIKEAWTTVEVEVANLKVERLRSEAYKNEADPLFFKYQREEIEKSVWLDKIKEIKERYPYTASSQE